MKNYCILLCFACAVLVCAGFFYLPATVEGESGSGQKQPAFAERVEFERKIQAVFHERRVSSKENTKEKISLEVKF